MADKLAACPFSHSEQSKPCRWLAAWLPSGKREVEDGGWRGSEGGELNVSERWLRRPCRSPRTSLLFRSGDWKDLTGEKPKPVFCSTGKG